MPAALPNELLLGILEEAAATNTRTAYAICLVASWATQIAETHLYALIQTHYKEGADLVRRWLEETGQGKVPQRARYVRWLWVEASFEGSKDTIVRRLELEFNPALLTNLIRLFPNLQSIGWTQRHESGYNELWRLRNHQLRTYLLSSRLDSLPDEADGDVHGLNPLHLALSSRSEIYVAQTPPDTPSILDRVTHLRLNSYAWTLPNPPLGYYRNSTHLSIASDGGGSEMLVLFSGLFVCRLPKLEMYVIEMFERCTRESWVSCLKRVKERRSKGLPVFVMMRPDSLREDWEGEWLGGEGRSVWTRARVFTSEREQEDWAPPPPVLS
ncbi:hypothetical protein PUNSTDRAFT_147063 [Punctularia strigosozonata HHB-11173 SS5]|uniref:Uncharacterized protein n=1 Tax=Punctularia strigosozonata (strain HHB-11173) TaxID=741275 RepID=R7S2B5_PUNST|nr:uncharacterized protein PUNSTDRAFT_147063 [Punctularia strigosozonata HHB-11173 SS5]EIN03391.1 hypothetical protein PUNSTDRAFT_147063 [Punctularia strigosozonata HHB-11173 SS5]